MFYFTSIKYGLLKKKKKKKTPSYIYITFANFANFAQIRESLRCDKFYIDRFAKVYARKIFQIFLFFLQTCWLLLIMC